MFPQELTTKEELGNVFEDRQSMRSVLMMIRKKKDLKTLTKWYK